ncbi:MAG: hypothetical protein OYH77_03715 [Pseudomonadota bacterium]|nr:hypothetical protein [Pseudomonadota bacterium]
MVLKILGASILCLSCLGAEMDGHSSFLTSAQGGEQTRWAFDLSLLHKVHDGSLNFVYAFADNNNCGGRYSDQQIKADITASTDVWMNALRKWSGLTKPTVVSQYNFMRGKVVGNNVELDDAEFTPDLKIVFVCKYGRSYYSVKKLIAMFDERGKYAMSTLTHEMGHAFGLLDTYVGAFGASYDQSDCGVSKIVGCQPLAIMNISSWFPAATAVLGEDDIAGIRHLYRFIYAQETECPMGYNYEQNTGGCMPTNPLKFAIMQGDLRNAKILLQDVDDTKARIDTKDKQGRSYLHYAALRAASHGGETYQWLISKGASLAIKDKDGNTPRDLLLPQITAALKARHPLIAEELISLALKH